MRWVLKKIGKILFVVVLFACFIQAMIFALSASVVSFSIEAKNAVQREQYAHVRALIPMSEKQFQIIDRALQDFSQGIKANTAIDQAQKNRSIRSIVSLISVVLYGLSFFLLGGALFCLKYALGLLRSMRSGMQQALIMLTPKGFDAFLARLSEGYNNGEVRNYQLRVAVNNTEYSPDPMKSIPDWIKDFVQKHQGATISIMFFVYAKENTVAELKKLAV